jgi:Tfp pilus assembly protein FimT
MERVMVYQQRDGAGFTLIELMVVLLISILLTLTALALYQRTIRRSALQGEAIGLALRLEQAKTLAQARGKEYRLSFDQAGRSYLAELFDPAKDWVVAEEVSSRPIDLKRGVSFGFPQSSNNPNYGPTVKNITTAIPPSPSAVQFNSRGFPVLPLSSGPPQPLQYRSENAVYLTDGSDFFAVTVDILGLVNVWAFDGKQWVHISSLKK